MNKHTFDALINHPYVGSLWLQDVRLVDGYVVGSALNSQEVGSSYMPMDYRGELVDMNFPIRCIRKVQKTRRER